MFLISVLIVGSVEYTFSGEYAKSPLYFLHGTVKRGIIHDKRGVMHDKRGVMHDKCTMICQNRSTSQLTLTPVTMRVQSGVWILGISRFDFVCLHDPRSQWGNHHPCGVYPYRSTPIAQISAVFALYGSLCLLCI